MSTKAYLLVETAVGKTREVADSLQVLEGVESVDIITGPYDIITIINADDTDVLGRMVIERIRTVSGVVKTETCIAVSNGAVAAPR